MNAASRTGNERTPAVARQEAEAALARLIDACGVGEGRLRAIGHLVAGRWVARGEARFDTATPIDGRHLASVAAGDEGDVARAAEAAAAAFDDWRKLAPARRKQILHRLADAIEEHADEIALLEVLDTGQPLRFMRQAAVRGAENFRFFADRCEGAQDGRSLPAEGFLNYTRRRPIGPVGVITPWNTPFMLSTWKIAPALAAGCTVVHKPAEWSPLTATLLAHLALEAGIPAGVWNVVHGLGESAGKALTEHPEIKAVAFVGESVTGSRIMAQGAPTLKRVALRPDLVPDVSTTEGLSEAFPPGEGRVLLPRADIATEVLATGLAAKGYEPHDVAAYRTVTPDALDGDALARLGAGTIDVVALASSSTARSFAALAGGRPGRAKLVSIGPVTSATCAELGLEVAVEADPHDLDGLVEAIVEAAGR